jgi:hypothetical protein
MPDILRTLVSDPESVDAFVRQGRRKIYGGLGTGSIFLDMGGGLLGGKGYKQKMYENFTRPVLNVDERLGAGAVKHAPGSLKRLFLKKELYDVPGAVRGMSLKAERLTPSLTEPLMKTKNLAVPLVAAIGLSTWLAKKRKEKEREKLIQEYFAQFQ